MDKFWEGIWCALLVIVIIYVIGLITFVIQDLYL